ncbi:hypothetical protein NHF46_16825 [Arthrobacter alpinus]|nr:hypothetical protein [Arthrobacter alpinus]
MGAESESTVAPRWDLRFSRIIPVDQDEHGQLRFRYEFLLPLHVIRGLGPRWATGTGRMAKRRRC